MSLRSTIRQIQAHDSDTAAISANRNGFVQKWNDDLQLLYNKIKSDLNEFVNEGLLIIYNVNFDVSEEALGIT